MPRYNVTAPDGSVIPVDAPDGATEQQAIAFAASTWKPKDAVSPAPTSAEVTPEFKAASAKSLARGESPILAGAADLLSGLTTLPRNAINAVSNLFPSSNTLSTLVTGQQPQNNLGNKIFPQTGVDTNSGLYLTGEILDPNAMALGGTAFKGAAAAAQGAARVIPKVGYLGQYGQGVLAGAGTGGAVGAVTPGQDAATGAGIGAVASAVLPPVISGIGKGTGFLWDLLRGNLAGVNAGKIAREAAGGKIATIQAANSAAPADLSAAQAAYGINQDTWQALAEVAKRGDKESFYRLLADTQKNNDVAALARLAGGSNQTEAKVARQSASGTLNAITTPMRDAELAAANNTGTIATNLQGKITSKQGAVDGLMTADAAEAAKALPYMASHDSTYARLAAGQAADRDFAQRQLDSLAAHGLEPINTNTIVGALKEKIADPSIGPNDLNRRVLNKISILIQDWTEKNGGVIDARALYEIRKSAVNNEVERLLAGADPKAQAKRAASLAMEIKPLIDSAIEKAGGTGWSNYLKTFELGMRDINAKQLSAKALELYQKSPQKFAELVNGNDPKTVEKIFGPGKYDIKDVMGVKYPVLRQIADNVERTAGIKTQAEAGAAPLQGILNKDFMGYRIPALFNRAATVTNSLLSAIENNVNRKTMAVLTEGMKSGKSANELLNTLPTSERFKVLNAMRGSAPWLPLGTGGAVQATAQEQ